MLKIPWSQSWNVCLPLLLLLFFLSLFLLSRSLGCLCLVKISSCWEVAVYYFPRTDLHSVLLYCKLLCAWIAKALVDLTFACSYRLFTTQIYCFNWHLLSSLKLRGAVGQLGLSIVCVQLHVLSLPCRLHVTCDSLWTGHALTNERGCRILWGFICVRRLKSFRPKLKSRRIVNWKKRS